VIVAAVGKGTARALADAGLAVDVVGPGGGRELAAALELAEGARVLFPCAEEALPDLSAALEERGHAVERLPVYRTLPVAAADLAPDADARIFMSPSSVRAALAWERAHPGRHTVRVALGASTMEALEREGLNAVNAASAGGEAPDVPGVPDVFGAVLACLAERLPQQLARAEAQPEETR
jgi:uroporphyrinogen-III synthase